MRFKTLSGNTANLSLAPYKVNWAAQGLSKFQKRVKDFLRENFSSNISWYEEVPLRGKDVSRMRFDFLGVFKDKWGEEKRVVVECHGIQHVAFCAKFHKSRADFEDQQYRDEIKEMYAEVNGMDFVEFFEDDELTLEEFLDNYSDVLPLKP